MKKVLCFSDVHLGLRTYSYQRESGLFDAEIEARIALDEVYEKSKDSDIDMIICAGDIFHTSHPTSKNIEFFIGWLKKMDSLGKRFYIIPGNHDVSDHSHSIIFMNKLKLNNIYLVDSNTETNGASAYSKFGDWTILFVPYLPYETSKEKDLPTFNMVKELISKPFDKVILVTHIHEAEAKTGSEGVMLARRVANMNFDEFNKKMILLTGHIHRHQVYTKKKGTMVVYPGSLFYNDYSDVNQDKGYVLIDESGNIEFKALQNIRKFVFYTISKDRDVFEFFNGFRIGTNKVVFLKIEQDDRVNERDLRELLKEKGCTLGKVFYKKEDIEEVDTDIDLEESDPFIIFDEDIKEWTEKEGKKDILEDFIEIGHQCLGEAIK